MRAIVLGLLTSVLVTLPVEGNADNKVCYWSAEGLEYSMTTPRDAGEALFSGGPTQAVYAIINASPHLIYKHACGTVTEADLGKPRALYRRWGCSPDSSVGQMVDGLGSGGKLIWEQMSYVDYAVEEFADEFAVKCPLLDEIDPICFVLATPFPKDVEQHPECVEAWPRIRAFEIFFSEIMRRDSSVRISLNKKDRALLRSAGGE